jgi:hypothetical protein
MRISMMLETSKNRPTRLSAAGEKKVNCESAVGFFISSLPLMILYVESVFAPSLPWNLHTRIGDPGHESMWSRMSSSQKFGRFPEVFTKSEAWNM